MAELIGNPYYHLETRKKQLERQRAELLAQARIAREMAAPATGEMVSGHYVPNHWSAYLQQPTAQLANAVSQGMADRDERVAAAEEASAASAHMANMPSAKTTEFKAPFMEGEEAPLTGNKTVTQPTREEKIRWAQTGMGIPSLKQTLEKAMEDQLINEPIREQARGEKVLDRQAYGQRPPRDRIEQFTDFDGKQYLVNQDTGNVTELKDLKAAVKQPTGETFVPVKDAEGRIRILNKRTGKLTEPTGPVKPMTGASSGKPMTDKARADLDADEAAIRGMTEATESIKSASGKGTGYAAGLVQEYLPGGSTLVAMVRDKSTKDAIQQLTYWGDGIRHGRFGASLTKAEKESAAQYLPSAYDNKEELQRKAEGLQGLLDKSNRRLREQGARVGGATGSWDAAPVRVTTPAEAAKLPKGTRFVTPDGQERVRQ